MEFQKITLEQRDLFNHYLQGRRHELAAYTFNALYIWRDWDPYGWIILNDALCIKSDFRGFDAVFPPITPDDNARLRATETLINWYEQRNVPFLINEASSATVEFYNRYLPGAFVAEEFKGGTNYIYRQKDLAYLRGKKYSAKRNHINRFIRENSDFQLLPLNSELAQKCRKRLEEWADSYDMSDYDLQMEKTGVISALEHIDQLTGCRSACLMVGDSIEAFTIGEPLNDDTFLIHIEKGNKQLTGSFQVINQLFARDYCQDFLYINRAEDMNSAGQIKAKLSYHPCRLETKFLLRRSDQVNLKQTGAGR